MQDEVYALYVEATTTTMGTNTQIFFLLRIRAFQNPWTPNLPFKKKTSLTVFKPLFSRVKKKFPHIYIHMGEKFDSIEKWLEHGIRCFFKCQIWSPRVLKRTNPQ